MKIFVTVKLRARVPRVDQIDENHFVVAVNALPIEGRANEAVIRALADFLDVAPSRLRFVSGQTSKKKVFEFEQ